MTEAMTKIQWVPILMCMYFSALSTLWFLHSIDALLVYRTVPQTNRIFLLLNQCNFPKLCLDITKGK